MKTEWSKVIANTTGCEIWSCGRALNNRGTVTVLLVGKSRYRSDRRSKTSVRELSEDGWSLKHRLENGN